MHIRLYLLLKSLLTCAHLSTQNTMHTLCSEIHSLAASLEPLQVQCLLKMVVHC